MSRYASAVPRLLEVIGRWIAMILINGFDPRLRTRCSDAAQVPSELVRGMFEVMHRNHGVGLSAPQVGHDVRVVVCIRQGGPSQKPVELVLLNPVVRESSDLSVKREEACLSFPGFTAEKQRFENISVSYLDHNGLEHLLEATGAFAQVIQHELDHLEGVTLFDNALRIEKIAGGVPDLVEPEVWQMISLARERALKTGSAVMFRHLLSAILSIPSCAGFQAILQKRLHGESIEILRSDVDHFVLRPAEVSVDKLGAILGRSGDLMRVRKDPRLNTYHLLVALISDNAIQEIPDSWMRLGRLLAEDTL